MKLYNDRAPLAWVVWPSGARHKYIFRLKDELKLVKSAHVKPMGDEESVSTDYREAAAPAPAPAPASTSASVPSPPSSHKTSRTSLQSSISQDDIDTFMAVTSASEEVARTMLRRCIDRGQPDPLQFAISEFFDQPSSATSHSSFSASAASSSDALKNNQPVPAAASSSASSYSSSSSSSSSSSTSSSSSSAARRRDPSGGIPQVGDYVERGSGWCDGDEDGGNALLASRSMMSLQSSPSSSPRMRKCFLLLVFVAYLSAFHTIVPMSSVGQGRAGQEREGSAKQGKAGQGRAE